MPTLYHTPASIGYLTQLVISGTITIYLLYLLRRGANPSATHFLLAGSFGLLTTYIGLLFLDVALLPTPRLFIVFLENPVLGFALVLLLQFAYHFPASSLRHKREARLVLAVSLAYALYESIYAVTRYVALAQGIVNYRPGWADIILAALFVWIPVAFLRQSINADLRPVGWIKKLSHPQGADAHKARFFAIIFLIAPALAVINLLRGMSLLSTAVFNITLSIGLLGSMLLFIAAYLNWLPATTSFMVKLSGLTLALLLSVLGIVGWAVAPSHVQDVLPTLGDSQTLHFSPVQQGGGYEIAAAPYQYETELGERLTVTTSGAGRSQAVALPFDFPFYGQTYSQVYVTSVGLIRLDAPLYHPNLQNNYGYFPGIFPLLVDLDPSQGGGVFARVETDRLVVTWDHLPALHYPQAVFTFQAVLYPDGSFDLTYNELPSPLPFALDGNPSANPWLRGVTSGLPALPEQTADLSQATQVGAQGLVQDLYVEFRSELNHACEPLAWLILFASLFLLAALPVFLHATLVKPLQALLHGVEKMNNGNLEWQVPVHHQDEIGWLTQTFNAMVSRLHSLITGLETSVAERTEELQDTNAQLRIEIAKREAAQEKVLQQQRALAALEERERMGRDLHDGLGQMVGAINVQTQAVQSLLEEHKLEAALANLDQVANLARDALTSIRSFILGLRNAPAGENFYASLLASLETFQSETGVQAILSIPPDAPAMAFTPIVEEQVLHVIQEALANVRKHAAAKKVEILFSFDSRQAQLIIMDDGRGFDVHQPPADALPHFGLGIIRERLESVGGRFEVRSTPGQGTRLLASIPRSVAGSAPRPAAGAHNPAGLRILLVDDSPIFLDGLRNLLVARGLTVVGAAHDGQEALELTRSLRPEVVVMDVEMPGCNGLEATRLIKAEFPEVKVVMLSVSESNEHLFEAIRNGASGYLLKNMEANQFVELLGGIAHNEAPLTPELAARLVKEFSQGSHPAAGSRGSDETLSDRQWQILELVTRGMAYKEIGVMLNLSEPTIKYHMAQIIDRLHLENRAQAVAYARRVGRQR